MNAENEDQSKVALESWMQQQFALTEADEIHFPSFEKMFRRNLEEVRQESKVDPVTDHLTLVEADEPEKGTCREVVENCTKNRFKFYLLAINAKHGPAYAEAFARECDNLWNIERPSEAAYSALDQTFPKPAVNLAWADARDTCLRLGHSEAYAKRCADELLDNNFSFTSAHEVTREFFKNFQIGLEHEYSELRATMFAEYQGPKWRSGPAPIAELFSRVVEEQITRGRPLNEAQQFADYYAECFAVDGTFPLAEENDLRDVATVQAEAKCRFRALEDGDRDQFVSLFEKIAKKAPSDSRNKNIAWFDEVERIFRDSYSLSQVDKLSDRRCWIPKIKQSSGSGL